MAKTKKKVVIGNWKMNPATLADAKKIFTGIKKTANTLKKVETVIAPPALYFTELQKAAQKSSLALGVQDTFFVEATGSHTGFISPLMAKNAGAEWVILGHTERRVQGETNEILNKKLLAAVKVGLKVAYCIGEKERNADGSYLEFIKNQIKLGLSGVEKKSLAQIAIAYEPVFIIGAKEAMQARDIHVMKLYIQKILIELFGKDDAANVAVLYGGSVNPENTEAIMKEGEVDGLLVGRDSLNPENFGKILAIANRIK